MEGMESFWVAALWSILPTLVVGGIFWYVLRSAIHSDRNERRAYVRIEAEERAKLGLPPRTDSSPARTDEASSTAS